MRRYLLILATMVATLCVHAQDEDELVNEVGISYGIVANSNFLDVYTESISGKSGTYFGPLALEYFHHLTPMISVGGVGVCKSHRETINSTSDKEKSGAFNFQVSAVGLEVGGKRFRLFTELGWGEQGLACAGLRCKF